MGKEIRILRSRLLDEGEKTKLEFDLEAGDKKGTLWFRTSAKWKEYVCSGLADGVVVTLLLYAVKGHFDIVSELPVSKSLLNRLNNHVIPQLNLCTPDSYGAKIICPVSGTVYRPARVATAMSMGVDAFTTFFEYTKDCPPESERIDLLTFMQSGQTSFAEHEDETFAGQLEDAERFCREYGFELLDVSSNLYSLYKEMFWDEWMIHVSTYRNCGMMLLFQKLIRTYYYSSSYNLDEFHCSLSEDVTHYEKWLLPNISTDALCFYNSNKAMTRLEKTRYISQYPETYRYLQVCCYHRHSCGICNKCIRTMFTLEYLGVLDNYSTVFDVETFRKNRKRRLRALLSYGGNSIDAEVIALYRKDIAVRDRILPGMLSFALNSRTIHKMVSRMYEKHPKTRDVVRAVKRKIF